jgi:hypothetical protein
MCGKEELRIGHWNTRWGETEGDSFIAKALCKTLRKLPPLHVSDFVRRIPLPLQTLTHRNTSLVAPTSLFIILARQPALCRAVTEPVTSINI